MRALARTVVLAIAVATTSAALAQQPASPPQAAPAVPQVSTPPPAPSSQAAGAPGGRRDIIGACKADFNTLCKDASGLGARLQCLRDNRARLSPDCSGAVNAVLGSIQAKAAAGQLPRPLQACQQDLATLCPDLGKGEPGRMKCLRDNTAKLSPGCAEAIKAARDTARTRMQVCEADRARLCASAGKQPAEQMRCLRDKQTELSPDCRQMVAAARAAAPKLSGQGDGAAAAPRPLPAPTASPPAPLPPAAAPTQPQAPKG